MPDDKPSTTGDRADRLYALTLQKRALDTTLKGLKKAIETLEQELITELDTLGTTALKSKTASIYVTETEVPNFTDFQLFQDWVVSENAQYLYTKRIRTEAWRELRQAGIDVPGVSAFIKRTLSVGKR